MKQQFPTEILVIKMYSLLILSLKYRLRITIALSVDLKTIKESITIW